MSSPAAVSEYTKSKDLQVKLFVNNAEFSFRGVTDVNTDDRAIELIDQDILKDLVDIQISVYPEQQFGLQTTSVVVKTGEAVQSLPIIGVQNTERADVEQGEIDRLVLEQLNIMNLINKYKYGGLMQTGVAKTSNQTIDAYGSDERSKLQMLLSKGILEIGKEKSKADETREAAKLIATNTAVRRKMVKIDMVKRLCGFLDKVDENSS